jgi:hypothetical protein
MHLYNSKADLQRYEDCGFHYHGCLRVSVNPKVTLKVFHLTTRSQKLFELFVAFDDKRVQDFQMRRFVTKLH